MGYQDDVARMRMERQEQEIALERNQAVHAY